MRTRIVTAVVTIQPAPVHSYVGAEGKRRVDAPEPVADKERVGLESREERSVGIHRLGKLALPSLRISPSLGIPCTSTVTVPGSGPGATLIALAAIGPPPDEQHVGALMDDISRLIHRPDVAGHNTRSRPRP